MRAGRQAIDRVHGFMCDVSAGWAGRPGVGDRPRTRWAFEHFVNGVDLDELVDMDFGWREAGSTDFGG
jgi:hypothetical protein